MKESILDNYPGRKGNTGIIQFFVNNIPAHGRYFELFLGSGNLFLNKRPAAYNVLADIDESVINEHTRTLLRPGVHLTNTSYSDIFNRFIFTRNDFIYLDPPYPESARRTGKKYYKHEMVSHEEHLALLNECKAINANIMISTKHNDLYSQELKNWRMKEFNTVDHQGQCTEVIYMNYQEPAYLHQYDHLGEGFSDRQRIKRKIDRLISKLDNLPQHERTALIVEITKKNPLTIEQALSIAAPGHHRQE